MNFPRQLCLALVPSLVLLVSSLPAADREIDFNLEIRPILSNNCFQCHGPDEAERKGGTDGLALDTFKAATQDLGGYQAIVPGGPDKSELLTRVTSADPDLVMPPQGHGKKLSGREIQLLRTWIEQGAHYAAHWSYVKPQRPALPAVSNSKWPRNEIDSFILARLEREGLSPQEEADRYVLARRAALDLTGLPPTAEELESFLKDNDPEAYERYLDHLLQKPAFGEHWARMWLDLARYADSAGYADDPERTIWLFRDYVIRSFNSNKPFDQFTIEQIAGDLLPNPTPDQLIATAFHRNTLTNNEGGTNDEEFRNVAVVDRVNTTLAVWMGTTMACAQCHTHKFDPITQAEYFSVFAIFNQAKDRDLRDESPLYSYFTPEQLEQKKNLEAELLAMEEKVKTPTPALLAELDRWDREFPRRLVWTSLPPRKVTTESGRTATLDEDLVTITGEAEKDSYNISLPVHEQRLRAVQLEAIADSSLPGGGPGQSGGNFVITGLQAKLVPHENAPFNGRYVRIELPGKNKYLSLAEVQLFRGEENIATAGTATQNSTGYEGTPERAIDGKTDGEYFTGQSVTHTAEGNDPWWELDLKEEKEFDRIRIWNRTDGGAGSRLADFRISVLDDAREVLWSQSFSTPPTPSVDVSLLAGIPVEFSLATADDNQEGFDPGFVLKNPDPAKKGWAVGGKTGLSHTLTLITPRPRIIPKGWQLQLTIDQKSNFKKHTLGKFRVRITSDPQAEVWARTPSEVIDILNLPVAERTPDRQQRVQAHFLSITPQFHKERQQIEKLKQSIAAVKPITVPICEELPPDQKRITKIQIRGNYLELGEEVPPGTPAAFSPIPSPYRTDRLGLAHWLVSGENPLTARVIANRYWEQIFGIGLVSTSEDFGSQGDPPSHPELLDWLATELIRSGWDTKAFLKLLLSSATYRQSSRVTDELYQQDPDNRLLARGPRFRLSAETIRDQSLALAGLLSPKMYGHPVKPLQPQTGLNAAFGGAVDWKTSEGEDRFRRGLYTSWRRSNPYPSMMTFDAPNREVCTIRRVRTNTPLQALVTLNDPVYVEAAQGLARKTITDGGESTRSRAEFIIKHCLCRPAESIEIDRLVQLHEETLAHLQTRPESAKDLATNPVGPLPQGIDENEAAAWTVIANVVLNLDEVLMKR